MHNYHSAVGCFPPGGMNASNFTNGSSVADGWGAWSAHAQMLPYMEQTNIHNSLNFSIVCETNGNGEDAVQLTGIQRPISTFLCPSNTWCSYPQWSQIGVYQLPGQLLFRLRRVGHESVCRNSPHAELPVGAAAPNGMFQVFGPADRHPVGHRRDLEHDRHGRVDHRLQQGRLEQYLHLAARRHRILRTR